MTKDAVALFDPQGSLLFANPVMRPALGESTGSIERLLPDGHPYRLAVSAALQRHESPPPPPRHSWSSFPRLP